MLCLLCFSSLLKGLSPCLQLVFDLFDDLTGKALMHVGVSVRIGYSQHTAAIDCLFRVAFTYFLSVIGMT